MTVFRDKDGKEIKAAEFCKGRNDLPKRWVKQVQPEKKANKGKEVSADERDTHNK